MMVAFLPCPPPFSTRWSTTLLAANDRPNVTLQSDRRESQGLLARPVVRAAEWS
jgi:hypothetical protein